MFSLFFEVFKFTVPKFYQRVLGISLLASFITPIAVEFNSGLSFNSQFLLGCGRLALLVTVSGIAFGRDFCTSVEAKNQSSNLAIKLIRRTSASLMPNPCYQPFFLSVVALLSISFLLCPVFVQDSVRLRFLLSLMLNLFCSIRHLLMQRLSHQCFLVSDVILMSPELGQ